jgi:hypothetical protein
LPWKKHGKYCVFTFFLCRHCQPLRAMAPTPEGHLSGDTPSAIHASRTGRRMQRSGYRGYAVCEYFFDTSF